MKKILACSFVLSCLTSFATIDQPDVRTFRGTGYYADGWFDYQTSVSADKDGLIFGDKTKFVTSPRYVRPIRKVVLSVSATQTDPKRYLRLWPYVNGVEATKRIRAALPDTKVFLLTSFGTAPELAHAIRNGATGAFIKSAPTEEIVDAVRKVAAGREVFPEEVRQLLAESGQQSDLTDRQLEILTSVARGLSNAEIARQFNLSEITIKKHLSAIFEHLGVSNRTEAAALALRKQLLKS